MAKDTPLTVSQWKSIRDRTAEKLRGDTGNRIQTDTAIRYAERLMDAGWIDSAFIIAEDERIAAEKEAAQALREAEAAKAKPDTKRIHLNSPLAG